MEISDILSLVDRFDSALATSLELEHKDWKLKLEKAAPTVNSPAVSPPAATAISQLDTEPSFLRAPLVGTFYAAPGPESAPYVAAGETIRKGQTVCVLEAMKMMSEVPAPTDCIIEAVLVNDGELVGFDAPLFRIREV